ncbi:hypothetical protein L596_018183 [Steinernema carpocapsae]|uniref:Uncharacterized protein n=1 Tax=Steinernema carpocapsae TaxID=34508 RepID=A0A4U5N4N3_STECR|nr:hypothetical protein L596_018183 [Steinernema carpocapsae]
MNFPDTVFGRLTPSSETPFSVNRDKRLTIQEVESRLAASELFMHFSKLFFASSYSFIRSKTPQFMLFSGFRVSNFQILFALSDELSRFVPSIHASLIFPLAPPIPPALDHFLLDPLSISQLFFFFLHSNSKRCMFTTTSLDYAPRFS